jgi:hypothetical protein
MATAFLIEVTPVDWLNDLMTSEGCGGAPAIQMGYRTGWRCDVPDYGSAPPHKRRHSKREDRDTRRREQDFGQR